MVDEKHLDLGRLTKMAERSGRRANVAAKVYCLKTKLRAGRAEIFQEF